MLCRWTLWFALSVHRLQICDQIFVRIQSEHLALMPNNRKCNSSIWKVVFHKSLKLPGTIRIDRYRTMPFIAKIQVANNDDINCFSLEMAQMEFAIPTQQTMDFDSDSDANQISFRNCFAIIYLGLEWKSNWTRSLALSLSVCLLLVFIVSSHIFLVSEAKNGASGKQFHVIKTDAKLIWPCWI